MEKNRLTTLADSIFAIVMTLLVIEIRVPDLPSTTSSHELWVALVSITPTFLSYLLSFIVLFTYWRGHHFIVSGYARNIDSRLININAVFFFLLALIPFTSALLGLYSATQLVVILFSIHVILLGLVLYWMRNHILFADTIDNEKVSLEALWHSNIRVAVPILFAVLAILLTFFNNTVSLALLTLAVIFNLFTSSAHFVDWILEHVFDVKIKH